MRPLTEKQFHRLAILARGDMLVSGGNKRDWGSMYRHGLIDAREVGGKGRGWINGVRITPRRGRIQKDDA